MPVITRSAVLHLLLPFEPVGIIIVRGLPPSVAMGRALLREPYLRSSDRLETLLVVPTPPQGHWQYAVLVFAATTALGIPTCTVRYAQLARTGTVPGEVYTIAVTSMRQRRIQNDGRR